MDGLKSREENGLTGASLYNSMTKNHVLRRYTPRIRQDQLPRPYTSGRQNLTTTYSGETARDPDTPRLIEKYNTNTEFDIAYPCLFVVRYVKPATSKGR